MFAVSSEFYVCFCLFSLYYVFFAAVFCLPVAFDFVLLYSFNNSCCLLWRPLVLVVPFVLLGACMFVCA